MSDFYKVSGKKFALPVPSRGAGKTGGDAAQAGWTFSVRPGGWIIAESRTGERRRFAAFEAKGRMSLSLGGRLFFGELGQDRAGHGEHSAASDADLVAQFPGKVRKLLVSVGSQVNVGDPLILVEAMKMEFTVKAPFAGTVQKVLVTEGQQLSPGDRFFEIVESGVSNGG